MGGRKKKNVDPCQKQHTHQSLHIMPTRRTSSRRRSRRLSGGDRAALLAWKAQMEMANQMGQDQFTYNGRTYDRIGNSSKWKCNDELSERGCPKRYSQKKGARAERQEERMRRSSAKKAREVARKAAAAARKRMSDKKKAAAAERAFQREVRRMSGPKEKVYEPCKKEYQTRNAEGRCVGRKPCEDYQERNEKGNCVNKKSGLYALGISGGRKIRTGPRGGKYVLKGGKKVYL